MEEDRQSEPAAVSSSLLASRETASVQQDVETDDDKDTDYELTLVAVVGRKAPAAPSQHREITPVVEKKPVPQKNERVQGENEVEQRQHASRKQIMLLAERTQARKLNRKRGNLLLSQRAAGVTSRRRTELGNSVAAMASSGFGTGATGSMLALNASQEQTKWGEQTSVHSSTAPPSERACNRVVSAQPTQQQPPLLPVPGTGLKNTNPNRLMALPTMTTTATSRVPPVARNLNPENSMAPPNLLIPPTSSLAGTTTTSVVETNDPLLSNLPADVLHAAVLLNQHQQQQLLQHHQAAVKQLVLQQHASVLWNHERKLLQEQEAAATAALLQQKEAATSKAAFAQFLEMLEARNQQSICLFPGAAPLQAPLTLAPAAAPTVPNAARLRELPPTPVQPSLVQSKAATRATTTIQASIETNSSNWTMSTPLLELYCEDHQRRKDQKVSRLRQSMPERSSLQESSKAAPKEQRPLIPVEPAGLRHKQPPEEAVADSHKHVRSSQDGERTQTTRRLKPDLPTEIDRLIATQARQLSAGTKALLQQGFPPARGWKKTKNAANVQTTGSLSVRRNSELTVEKKKRQLFSSAKIPVSSAKDNAEPLTQRTRQRKDLKDVPPPSEKMILPRQENESFPLGIAEDASWLPQFHCFVRSNMIELFLFKRATTGAQSAQNLPGEFVEGFSICVRCRFCAHTPENLRAPHAMAIPASLDDLYPHCERMWRDHFPLCTHVPMDALQQLREESSDDSPLDDSAALQQQRYWVYAATQLGLAEESGGGIVMTRRRQPVDGRTPTAER